MQQPPDDLDYPHSDDLLLNNPSAHSHLRGDDRVDPAPSTTTIPTPTVEFPPSNGELFASIDKALSISLKRPSSRGSNLDLLATNVNSKLNSTSGAADGRNSRSRGGTGRVNKENKPGNVMSMSSSTSRDEVILVNSSVIPVPAAEESNNRDYSEGEGSETSRSQTMSNLTTSTQSYGYSHSSSGRCRNWSPLPSSRIGFDFRAPFPSVRHSPSNERRSYQSHHSHSQSSGRSSVETSSAYHDSHSSNSANRNNNNNKLTIGFKKSNEGYIYQSTLLVENMIIH